jgi:hypothetical protein
MRATLRAGCGLRYHSVHYTGRRSPIIQAKMRGDNFLFDVITNDSLLFLFSKKNRIGLFLRYNFAMDFTLNLFLSLFRLWANCAGDTSNETEVRANVHASLSITQRLLSWQASWHSMM